MTLQDIEKLHKALDLLYEVTGQSPEYLLTLLGTDNEVLSDDEKQRVLEVLLG